MRKYVGLSDKKEHKFSGKTVRKVWGSAYCSDA